MAGLSVTTFADGVATRVPFENTQRIMRRYLDDFVLVDDREIRAAIRLLLEHTHNLAEGAGAVSLAAALKLREQLAGRKTVIVLSGGNLSLENLRSILSEDSP
ncbi:MAG: pyridoxal-phosphate dependent enzyme [Planctomycetes bacterium]|nr:pyridoxal-phosphate dependent enzyme [Planctomycetota bacterium]